MGVEWRKGRWYIRFKSECGKWRYKATSYDRPTREHRDEAMKLYYALEREVLEPARLGIRPSPVAVQTLAPPPPRMTFAAACEWWLASVSSLTRSHAKNASAVRRHLLNAPFASMPVDTVTRAAISEWLAGKERDGLSAQTQNHLRMFVCRVYASLDERGKYDGPNPALRVKRKKVPRRIKDVLRGDEPARLMAHLLEHKTKKAKRRGRLYAAALYTGMRASELRRLKIGDVNLVERILYVREPKTGNDRLVPVHSELWPSLVAAIDEAQGGAASGLSPAGPGNRRTWTPRGRGNSGST